MGGKAGEPLPIRRRQVLDENYRAHYRKILAIDSNASGGSSQAHDQMLRNGQKL